MAFNLTSMVIRYLVSLIIYFLCPAILFFYKNCVVLFKIKKKKAFIIIFREMMERRNLTQLVMIKIW